MKDCFINSGLWVSLESFITFLKTIFKENFKGHFKQINAVVETKFNRCFPGFNTGYISFFVYIKNLPHELKSSEKLFADDTSFSTIVKNKNESTKIHNNNLLLISKWVYNW